MFRLTLARKLIGMSLVIVILCSISSVIGNRIMHEQKISVETLGSTALPSVVLLGNLESNINLLDRHSVFSLLGTMMSPPSQDTPKDKPVDGQPPAADDAQPSAGESNDQPKGDTFGDTTQSIKDTVANIEKDIKDYQDHYLTAGVETEIFNAFYTAWTGYRDNVMFNSGSSTDVPQGEAKQANTGDLYAAALESISKLKKQNISDAEALLEHSQNRTETGSLTHMLSAIISVVIALLGAYLISRSITKPLSAIVKQVKLVTSGDLMVNPLVVKNKDEIGELATDFNEMSQSLRTLMTTVKENSILVASTSEQLTASAEQTTSATEQISDNASELADGAKEQLERVSTTTETAVGVSNKVDTITKSFTKVATLITEAQDKAVKGNSVITSTVTQMRGAHEKVTHSAEAVNILAHKSAEINQITSMIKEIASQTHLLSLNAAIEAARAGDHGKGFAVVASEVGKLANQSEDATKKITDLVNEIIRSTNQVMSSMKDGVQSLSDGMDYMEDAGLSFSEIVGSVEEIGMEAEYAVKAVNSVNDNTVSMVASIHEISEIAERATKNTQTVASVVGQTMASMEEVSAGSKMLSRMADDLNQAVAKFKV
ncbi:methyl-accepting chemotaxis protein [Paenibacillus phyllosphaerae]|uniref:Methyl-accepting chemotaxis protein n=1 Tax=Paenibacillus phyllosphaerae TaxID=274593 RepID=A0A7W5B485_9BACL|nr:methyl-accepting chemotaxis protein [Paenibacillus phyllosphaerae]MBB3114068.1 methyl-accepting chemotaxis protein [Paenibacillus phyllosphaerae]